MLYAFHQFAIQDLILFGDLFASSHLLKLKSQDLIHHVIVGPGTWNFLDSDLVFIMTGNPMMDFMNNVLKLRYLFDYLFFRIKLGLLC